MNITKVNGSYSKELYENRDLIEQIYKDPSLSVAYMKAVILDIIKPAWITAKAKLRFKNSLAECHSKYAVYKLCNNTINKAINYKPTRTY